MDERTKDEKGWMKLMQTKPQVELIKDLYLELSLCYELMSAEAKHILNAKHYRVKKQEYYHFFTLLNDDWFYKNLEKRNKKKVKK